MPGREPLLSNTGMKATFVLLFSLLQITKSTAESSAETTSQAPVSHLQRALFHECRLVLSNQVFIFVLKTLSAVDSGQSLKFSFVLQTVAVRLDFCSILPVLIHALPPLYCLCCCYSSKMWLISCIVCIYLVQKHKSSFTLDAKLLHLLASPGAPSESETILCIHAVTQ